MPTLTDGVFAIAMTILVLELSVPAASAIGEDAELGDALVEMWPDFAIYGLSFLVLGMFWLMHHAIFESVIHHDMPLQWLNIAFLMFAGLLPFSTALFGEHGATTASSLVYGSNILAIMLVLWAVWNHAATGHRLVRTDLDPALIRGPRLMGRAYIVVLAVPLGLSFVAPEASFVLYGAIVAGFFLATVTNRWEIAMVWRPTHHASKIAAGDASPAPVDPETEWGGTS